MRRYGIENPYEKLKALTRGQRVTREMMEEFLENLEMPEEGKKLLRGLTPATYIGKAAEFAKNI
jgi:adenylosuccinate lyase